MRRIGLTSLLALVLPMSEWQSVIAAPPLVPLKLSIKKIIPLARSHAPQTLEVNIGCNSPELFQGRLELKFYLEQRLVHDYLSHDLAITAGGHRFRMMLPPLVVHGEKTNFLAYGRFIMEKRIIDLVEPVALSVPTAWKRSLVAAVVHPQEMMVPPGNRGMPESINLEQFNPFSALTFDAQSGSQHDLLTHAPRLTPEDLPSSALGYASFDLLFVEAEGFQRLRAKQLAAIGDWTAAGGSLAVAPSGKLSADHVDLLNRLAGSNFEGKKRSRAKPAAYTLSEEGQLEIGASVSATGAKFVRHCYGLGRVLMIHDRLNPEVDFATQEWKAAVAFLWKVRDSQTEQILRTGTWNFPSQERQGRMGAFRPYAPQRDELPRNIRQILLPERIEGVPLWVVVIILSLYLVIIAPGDYFLLGRLHCRKYTWAFFAVISAAFTGSTVMIAESYMGHADYRTSLVFADLCEGDDWRGDDSNGENSSGDATGGNTKLARVSRFEMLFTASQRQIEIEARNELYVDITDRAVMPDASRKDRHSFAFADEEETDVIDAVSADLPVYAGHMPGAFAILQQMRQWSPRVNRRTSFGDDPALLAETAVDWRGLRPDEWTTPQGRQKLREAVLAKEPAARVLLFHGTSCFDLINDGLVQVPALVPAPGKPGVDAQTPFNLLPNSPVVSLVHAASVRPESGLFKVVSQVSPTGGENLEDMTLLDGSDAEQWLLAVVLHRGHDWFVFRKLYHGRQP